MVTDSIIETLIKKFGIWLTIFVLAILSIIGFYSNYKKQEIIEKQRNELSKITQKDVEVWKTQKELVFEFIDIFEDDLLKADFTDEATKKEAIKHYEKRIGNWYGKAYVVFDSAIISNINNILKSQVGHVQRYYLYSNIRSQILTGLFDARYRKCPYISRSVISTETGATRAKSYNELKKRYPFIEHGDEPNTYKALPVFNVETISSNNDQ